jgi:hypothetical protein
MLHNHKKLLYPNCKDGQKWLHPLPRWGIREFKCIFNMQKVHARPNDFILYHGEECENLNVYSIYSALWYKIRRDNLVILRVSTPKKRVLPSYKVYSNVEHEWTRNGRTGIVHRPRNYSPTKISTFTAQIFSRRVTVQSVFTRTMYKSVYELG